MRRSAKYINSIGANGQGKKCLKALMPLSVSYLSCQSIDQTKLLYAKYVRWSAAAKLQPSMTTDILRQAPLADEVNKGRQQQYNKRILPFTVKYEILGRGYEDLPCL